MGNKRWQVQVMPILHSRDCILSVLSLLPSSYKYFLLIHFGHIHYSYLVLISEFLLF
uniref:Uncharacterized protein n=1 Tax=Colobus angolensis palliatus TaxID=336983 RepID=A0A2K5JNW4_COLAP